MTEGKCDIVGIGRSEEAAALRPSAGIEASISEISTETAGKIFVALDVKTPGSIVLGMDVNGEPVEVCSNEKTAHTDLVPTDGRFESYALDLPMRVIGNEKQKFPAVHTLTIRWGNMQGESPVWNGAETFTITVTGTGPKVKYDPYKDSD